MTFDFDRIVDRRGTDSNKWHKFGPDVLPLWVADMDFPSPPPVVDALRARVEHGIFGYLREGAPELVEVFTERCRKRYGWDVPPEAIMLLPGVNPANNVAARAVCEPGDGFVILTPAYPPLLRVPGNVGLEAQLPVLARRPDGRYEIDFDAFERAITPRTKAFLLCNPHNPVDRVYTRADLSRDVHRHVPGVTMAKPEGAYLAWLDCQPAGIADPFTFFLEKAKVAFNNGKLFGAPGDGFVRLNFGTPRALLTEGLERMRKTLAAR